MNIQEYLTKLNDQSQKIFRNSLRYQNELGKAHHLSACIYELSDHIYDQSEKDILVIVSAQLESATLNVAMGMYRQAYSSLRLALELGLGAAHFSVHKLELKEWLDGRADLKWADLIDEHNGVLSSRFSDAFFKELSSESDKYRKKAIAAYRKLSEDTYYPHIYDRAGFTAKYKYYYLESNIYAVYNKELIWTAVTEALDPRNMTKEIKVFANEIVSAIKRSALI